MARRSHENGRRQLVDASGSTDRAASAFCSSTTWLPETWAHPAKQLLGDWYTRLGYHVFRTRDFGCAYPHMAPLLATPCDLVTYRKCTS